ncbi:MAG TPA: nitroreductase/quinone reductase family protein [Anaerolineales bacterium]|nr:nitroreductase/quinone reductase family protein [Anaerolineales bacterium]
METSTPTLSLPEKALRKFFHFMNHFMVWMWKMGWGEWINFWPEGMGRIMVIKHRGRKSGKEYLTPVNYAVVDGEVYCTAGFGSISDWYRNMLVNPQVELWLPDGKRAVCAEDISNSPERLSLLRQVLIAAGFAASTFGGINPRKMSDEEIDRATKEYRLVHFASQK